VLKVDLNCDMGEGMDTDAAIFPFISSANIACGGHAGDTGTMRQTVALALQHGVAIGAHPSYPDRAGFGRTDQLESSPGKGDGPLRLEDLGAMLTDQLEQLQKIAAETGARLHHVKPHGALYNRAAKDAVVSGIICRVIKSFDPSLLLYGLSGSEMRRQATAFGLGFVSEVFADRTYQPDGSLTPRTAHHALIDQPEAMVRQVLMMVREGKVRAEGGFDVPIAADTICLHGDGDHAVEFAVRIRGELERNGIAVGI
jgi:5-oxoprolinase (ATP-hydrolysing) subunit A